MKMPIIPGHSTQAKTRTTKYWQYRNVPSIYMPAQANMHEDQTKYYIKTPQEMSRYEIAELEKELRDINEVDDETIADEADFKELQANPEYRRFIQKMKTLAKLRHGVIKRYFEQHKYKRNHRNEIIEAAEETEVAIQEILRDDHVHFLDANPEIREFMEQVNKDQTIKIEAAEEKTGRKQGDLPDIKRLQLDKKEEVTTRRQKKKNPWEGVLAKEFESPSSMTEDSDDKGSLSERGFKLSYKDLGVPEVKTTADEVTSMTDEATESANDGATSERTSAPDQTSHDEGEFKAAAAEKDPVETETQTDVDSQPETATEEAKTTDTEEANATTAEETEKEEKKVEQEEKEEKQSGGWFSSLFGGKKK